MQYHYYHGHRGTRSLDYQPNLRPTVHIAPYRGAAADSLVPLRDHHGNRSTAHLLALSNHLPVAKHTGNYGYIFNRKTYDNRKTYEHDPSWKPNPLWAQHNPYHYPPTVNFTGVERGLPRFQANFRLRTRAPPLRPAPAPQQFANAENDELAPSAANYPACGYKSCKAKWAAAAVLKMNRTAGAAGAAGASGTAGGAPLWCTPQHSVLHPDSAAWADSKGLESSGDTSIRSVDTEATSDISIASASGDISIASSGDMDASFEDDAASDDGSVYYEDEGCGFPSCIYPHKLIPNPYPKLAPATPATPELPSPPSTPEASSKRSSFASTSSKVDELAAALAGAYGRRPPPHTAAPPSTPAFRPFDFED